jgi:predicted nucleic acid-binding protein
MRYFDSDVLVHYFVNYEPVKHQQAQKLLKQAVDEGLFYISLLSVQETTFAMAKLRQPLLEINEAFKQLLLTKPVAYEISDFQQASQLPQHLGFQNINDCLHTALAEANNCTELITYNRKDFVHIHPHSRLEITIL